MTEKLHACCFLLPGGKTADLYLMHTGYPWSSLTRTPALPVDIRSPGSYLAENFVSLDHLFVVSLPTSSNALSFQ